MEPEHRIISSSSHYAEISPLGAELKRLTAIHGEDLLWSGDAAWWGATSPLLFPIIGSLVNDTYRVEQCDYRLPRHGFARRSRFELRGASDQSVTYGLAADASTLAVFPFRFDLEVSYSLRAATLAIDAAVTNCDTKPMPFSFGFHPAFRWPLVTGVTRTAHRIRFEGVEPRSVRRLGASGLLDPVPQATPVRGRTLRLSDRLFSNDVLIFDQLASRRLSYGTPGGPQLEITFPNMPYLAIWSKPGAGFVCIEPWQGFADPEGFMGEFADKPGGVLLPSKATRRFAMTITS